MDTWWFTPVFIVYFLLYGTVTRVQQKNHLFESKPVIKEYSVVSTHPLESIKGTKHVLSKQTYIWENNTSKNHW